MVKTFDKTFTAHQQKKDQNLQAIHELESISLQRLLPMTNMPSNKVSQRERVKAKKLRNIYAGSEHINTKEEDVILFVTLKPLYYLNVEKLQHLYMPKPMLKELMPTTQIKEMLHETIRQVQEEIGLTYKFRNIFKKDGTRVWDIYDLCAADKLFFITSKDSFIGVQAALEKYPKGMKKFMGTVKFKS